MDQRLQYEQTIAGKLQSLPIPDMQDAIWERVKFQLDLDMPEDDGTGGTPPAPSGPGLIGWGLSVLLIAFLTIFFILKNKQTENSTENNTATGRELITPAENSNAPPGNLKRGNIITNKNIDNTTAIPTFMQNGLQDSALQNNAPVIMPPLFDSAVSKPAGDLVQAQPLVDTIPSANKKQRGVQGLSPDDFKIVPKKDSTNRQ